MAEFVKDTNIITEEGQTPSEQVIKKDHPPTEKHQLLWDRVKSQRIPEEVDFESIEDGFLFKIKHKHPSLILTDYEKCTEVNVQGESTLLSIS